VNKICIDTKTYNLDIKDSDTYIIEILENDTVINIHVLEEKTSRLCLFMDKSKVKININLEKNSSLLINQLGINSSVDYLTNLSYQSNLKVIDSILTNIDSINKIDINHKESNSTCNFITRGINLSNNKFYFLINGIINKDSFNVTLDENSRIININKGESKIIPNLIVDNKEVVANHSAFIGKFNLEDIYYLNSRGIDKKLAIKLMVKSFLLGNMESEFNELEFIKILIDNNIFLDSEIEI